MEDHENNSNKKHYVRAAYAPDGDSAGAMIAALREHGIDAFRHGGVKDIYKIGGDICGEEIMVDPENLTKAREVLGQVSLDDKSPAKPAASARRTILCLIAAAALFAVLLFLRGKLLP